MLGAGLDGLGHVAGEARLVVDDLHRPAAQHEARPDDDRVADPLGDPPRLARSCVAEPLGVCLRPSRSITRRNRSRSSARSMLSGLVPMIGTPGRLQGPRQVQRGLAAELDDHAHRLDPLADVEHVLDRQRLEEEAVGRVVVGADGLRVRVDHHHFVAVGLQGEGGLAAAVVELDPLADPVRAAAEDDDPRLVADARLVLVLVGRIVIGRDRLELGGAGVDQLEDGVDPPPRRSRRTSVSLDAQRWASCRSENPFALGLADQVVAGGVRPGAARSRPSRRTISSMFWRNQGSIGSAPWIWSTSMPARKA